MKRATIILTSAVLIAACCGSPKSNLPVYLDTTKPLEERVEDALSRMTMEEKVALTHAQSKFSSHGVPRLGIPELWHTDGPHGIRPEVLWDEWNQAGWTNDSCTAFPALVNLAATWDRELSALYGKSIGEEARYREKDILLGPGINMGRTPLNGRTFEYMGEDPYLAAQLVVPYIKGVQEQGVAACVKHFAVNNQETRRTKTNSNVDDRTLYEIYFPAFKAAVQEGGAWAIMGSYNLWNGQYNCHNKRLLQEILKGEWGFDGVVISDWGGCRDDDEAANNGLDIEMGTWTNGLQGAASNTYDMYHLANPYLERLRDGRAKQEDLDDKARRVLRTIFRTSMGPETHYGSFTSPEHFAASRKIAAEGIVLLKNNGALPLNVDEISRQVRNDNSLPTILLVGENAYKMMVVGGGSSNLKTKYEIIPLDAIREAFEGKADVVWERGYVGDTRTDYNMVVTGQDLSESRSADQLKADAVAAAKEADVVIFIGGLNKSKHQDNEGTDREDIILPYGQDELIEALAEINPNLIVVNISGSPVAMPWADKVNAIVQAWYGGSENGHALADVLTGAVNPSGKLPFTMPKALADGPIKTERQYPGIEVEGLPYWEEYYDEGVFIGYRWYSTQNIPVQYPFGYGLSYTTFELSGASLSKGAVKAGSNVTVNVTVKNTGDKAGAEVVQLYVNDAEASVERPVRELKGFQKVYLQPGEARKLSFTLTPADLSFFDAEAHDWKLEPGDFHILIGNSSENLPIDLLLTVK
ncbi:MAG: glycoside hydrolase family 3 C-terminal domain-containing protein [Bacteroidales bacterium]|nr:glycoside hydrolase family 3 C-terminal domain-containing protein [Bacteroidales bacterium]